MTKPGEFPLIEAIQDAPAMEQHREMQQNQRHAAEIFTAILQMEK
jgi:hypothetical protein